MKTSGPPLLHQHLCYKLYSTSLRMTQLYKPLLAPLNLTYPQYLMMVVLWEEEGLGMKDLAERLGQDNGSITPLVKRLEAMGYLIRNRNPNDERNRIITLSRAGKDLRAQGLKVSNEIHRLSGIGADEAIQLMSLLDQLNSNLAFSLSSSSDVDEPGATTDD
ncbi:MAG: MarR family transcriptional regulator [Pseudomonadota bacterium]